jgi:hypothetical protein
MNQRAVQILFLSYNTRVAIFHFCLKLNIVKSTKYIDQMAIANGIACRMSTD